ncbi:MAG: AraC family transcriptional regulator [Thermoanaerobacterium sp.]|nr:AraC family transcriptional regulator [Thermoanaerobacterium sp.]
MSKNIFTKKINSFFFKLLFMLTLFITVVILLLSLLLYYKSEALIKTMLTTSSQQRLSQASIGAENLSDNISRFTIAIYYGNSVYSTNNLLENPLIDDFEKYNIINTINTSLSTTPFVYSIHMLNMRNKSYYTAGPFPVAYSEYFYDTEILEMIQKDYQNIKLIPIPRTMPVNGLPNAKRINVLSYIYFEKDSFKNSVDNVIVVNIKADSLFDIVNAYNQSTSEQSGFIIVIDKTGHVLAHPERNLFNRDISNMNFINTILTNGDKLGSFVANIDGKRNFVTYKLSDKLGWYFISLSPLDKITDAITNFRTFTLIVCILTLLFGLFLSYLISRKLYSPVANLQNTIVKLSDNNVKYYEKSNEFEVISSIYAETLKQLANFRNFKQNNLQILKQKFLMDLLNGKLPHQNTLEYKAREYGLKISIDDKLVVIVFKIDDYDNFCNRFNQNDRSLMLYAIENILDELLSKHFKCDTVSAGNDHIAALINISYIENDIIECQNLIYSTIENIQENVVKYLGFSITASISPVSSCVSDLCEAYSQALENSDYRIIKGHKSIISPTTINNTNRKLYNLPAKKIKKLTDALKLQKYEAAVTAYNEIIEQICDCHPRVIRLAVPFLFSRVCECLTLINENIFDELSIDFVELNKKLSSFETIQWVNQEFYKLFKAVCANKKDNTTENIVRKVLDLIKSNYTDPQLNSDTISSQLNLSAAYVRRVFRKATGMSISEYINEIRMEKAKELLETSDLNISDILERIGWYNTKYFFSVFKKTYGITPMEYRLRVAKQR